mmetsp:Transcript_36723/g.54861  ORF Transcript_36723/g.54861 Transcript_36723/m.54861 type:complete len:115 (+) Transcript_36723:398-742(+)
MSSCFRLFDMDVLLLLLFVEICGKSSFITGIDVMVGLAIIVDNVAAVEDEEDEAVYDLAVVFTRGRDDDDDDEEDEKEVASVLAVIFTRGGGGSMLPDDEDDEKEASCLLVVAV